MLHHTRRWNRDHSDELRSAWLNGVGMLVWENVFGSWVGWSERDRALLKAMTAVQRRHADLLTHGEWTPLAARSADVSVVGSRWRQGDAELWALANLGGAFAGTVSLDGREVVARAAGEGARGDHRGRRRGVRRRLAGVSGAGDRPRSRSGGPRRGRARRVRRRARRRVRSWRGSVSARPGSTARCRMSRSGSRCRPGCTASPRSSGRRPRAGSRSASAR